MRFNFTPRVGPRYWMAICLASMCGTNLGDVFPDLLGLGSGAALEVLAGLFTVLVIGDRLRGRGSELIYWAAILVVRAAATQIADFSIEQLHFTYRSTFAGLTIGLLALLALTPQSPGVAPFADGWYWVKMLLAGSLGTIVGDWLGHAFGPVTNGVPASAAIGSIVLAMIFVARSRMRLTSAAAYWVTIVAVRWWGTNTGDIVAFTASLPLSIPLTGGALMLVLAFWHERPAHDTGLQASSA